MRVVCFSCNAPPLNDPEAFCTARLLSAMSHHGAEVHLVTFDHAEEISRNAQSQLLDSRVPVTRVSGTTRGQVRCAAAMLKYGYPGPWAERIDPCVRELRRVLRQHPGAWLLTRSSPLLSNVVGYHCRAEAAGWIAHFSDPCPGIAAYSRRSLWRYTADRWWVRRIFERADLVTTTCRNAERWFRQSLGGRAAPEKMHVIGHIGVPVLGGGVPTLAGDTSCVNFTHVGLWNNRRRPQVILDEFRRAFAQYPHIRIYQFGPMERGQGEALSRECAQFFSASAAYNLSPEQASRIMMDSDVNVIVDQYDELEYCPYLASKFAYAVAAGRPILALGQRDSEMAKLHAEHGGFYFAEVGTPGDVCNAVSALARASRSEWLRPGAALRAQFEPATVARSLIARLAVLPIAAPRRSSKALA
jgi:hypothetical protein